MTDYKLTHATWLANEAERVASVLKQNMVKDEVYSQAALMKMVKDFGLDEYTNAELVEIRDKLIADGVIEEG